MFVCLYTHVYVYVYVYVNSWCGCKQLVARALVYMEKYISYYIYDTHTHTHTHTHTEATAVRLLWALRHLWAPPLRLYHSCLLPGEDKEEESTYTPSIPRLPTTRVSIYNVCFRM
jgi:hypothetical protein